MILHQHLVGRPQQSDNGQILLHDVDAVAVFFHHGADFCEQGGGFLEADADLFLFIVGDHNPLIIF